MDRDKKGQFIKGHKEGMFGKKHSIETKRKLRIHHNSKSNFNLNSHARLGKPSWNKGMGIIATLQHKIRQLLKYRQWRSDIFTRDNFTCQDCGKRGGKLIAHHIEEFTKILIKNKIRTIEEAELCEELWNINNGKTLCKNCHKKIKKQFNKHSFMKYGV